MPERVRKEFIQKKVIGLSNPNIQISIESLSEG